MLLAVAALSAAVAAPISTRRVGGFVVAEVDLREAELHLLGQGVDAAVRTFAAAQAWAEARGARTWVATNAGIFEPGERPTGLFVSGGVQLSPLNTRSGEGNFYLRPNGVFAVSADGHAAVVPTDRWDPASAPRLATQSGPLLLDGGQIHPAFRADSPNLRVRSGVCVPRDDDRRVLLFLSEAPVRLYDTAAFARDQLGCAHALYLDGVISGMAGSDLPGGVSRPGPFAGLLVAVPRP